MTPPPTWLDAAARRLWRALQPKLLAAGLYLPIDEQALAMLCEQQALAVRLAARRPTSAPPDAWLREVQVDVRQMAARFLVLPPARVHLVPVDGAGVDVEMAALFRPGVALPTVALTAGERRALAAWNERARELGMLPPASPSQGGIA